jgi:SNF2 family DNA or RNA helicase
LSGTPIVNTPTEIVTQLRVINRLEDFGGATKFRNTYGRATARNLAALNRKLRSTCYVRRRKADVLTELPPKMWSQVVVEGDPKIMTEYREAEANIVSYLAELARQMALDSGLSDKEAQEEAWRKAMRARAAEQLVAISTLKQLSAKAKMNAAKEWIENFLENDKKLVVFGWHRDVVDLIAENFSNGVKIQGGISAEKRQVAVDLFQTEDKQKVIACNIKAAGVGLTLTSASDVLFLEQGWTPADMEQAVDRCHRIGQTDSVTGWLMVTANTIDEDIAMLIDNKRTIVNRAIDGSDSDEMEEHSLLGDLLVSLAERGMSQAS